MPIRAAETHDVPDDVQDLVDSVVAAFQAARISRSEASGGTSRTSYQLGVATAVLTAVLIPGLPSPG